MYNESAGKLEEVR